MSEPSSNLARPLTSAEVVLLCDELRAVLAAGVPLHLGLRHAGELSANLQSAVDRLVHHLEQGRSLPEALEAEEHILPPVLRAIVVAGVCSEQTQDLLEELARTSEQLQQMRQSMIRGLVYPAVVVLLTLVLASFVFPMIAGALAAIYETTPLPNFLNIELRLAQFLRDYGQMLAFSVLILFVVYWIFSQRSRNELSGWAFVAWIPGTGQVLRDSRLARSIHLLSLLVRYRVPLPQALRSVAATVDSHALHDDILRAANQIERGEELSRQRGSRIPEFLWWMLTTGLRESRLEATLRDAANYYRRRAIQRAEWLSKVVPLTVVTFVAGGFTLAYGLFVMIPISDVLHFLLEMQP